MTTTRYRLTIENLETGQAEAGEVVLDDSPTSHLLIVPAPVEDPDRSTRTIPTGGMVSAVWLRLP